MTINGGLMTAMLKSARRMLLSFVNRSEGGVSVEFVLWMPVFVGLIAVIADASFMFMRQANFWNVSRDTARIVSRHALDAEEAEAYARDMARFGSYSPDVKVLVGDQTVTVTISGKAEAMAPFGVLGFAIGDTVSARVTQSLEPI